jgi:predicted metalloprotease with PDZ domain
MIGKIQVNLALPPGWGAITPWDVEHADSLFDVEHAASLFRADFLEEVVGSVFCIGQFQFAKRQLGEHEIYAIHSGAKEGKPDLERKVDEIVRVLKDYVMRFGDFRPKRYLAVFTEPTPGREYIHGSAHSVGFAGPVNVDYTFEIFHVWNGGIINQKSDYEGWFKEGFTQYYGYLTPYRVGLYSEERFLQHLKKDYEGYLKRYGTGDDMALTRVKEQLARKEGHHQPESARLWIMYYKGALVASRMDDEIKRRTGGIKSLDDLMYYMFHKFGDERYSSEDVLEALNAVTGRDFTGFFSNFVYGTAKLPMDGSISP